MAFTGTINQAKAKHAALKSQMETELDNQIIKGSGTDLVSNLGAYWLKHRAETGRGRESTLTRFSEHMARYVAPYMGDHRLCDVKPKVVLEWMVWLAKLETPQKQPYAVETLRGAWRTLRLFLKFSCTMAGLPNPSDGIHFSVKGKAAKTKEWLSLSDLQILMEAAQQERPRWRALLLLMGTTGVRFGEATAIAYSDILWETKEILISKSQTRGKMNATKTGKPRRVPLTPALEAALKEHRATTTPRDDGLVFFTDEGGYLHNGCTRLPLDRCLKRAGIKKRIGNHDLRRTVNNLVRQAAGATVAMDLLGHVTQDMHRHYSQVDAAERMAAVTSALGLGGTKGGSGQRAD